MPTRNVTLSPEHEQYIAGKIADGTCENASQVISAALRTLEREEREEQEDREKLAALRAAIAEGDASGLAEGDVFAQIRQEMGWTDEEL